MVAVARVAQGYLISGSVSGECKVWSRTGEPLYEYPPLEGEEGEAGAGEAAAAAEEETAAAAAAAAEGAEGAAPAGELTPEEEELKAAAAAKAALDAEYEGPWKCVGRFTAGAVGMVNAIIPLHQRPHPDPADEKDPAAAAAAAAAPVDVDSKPARVAVAMACTTGSLTHCVRVLDATKRWAVEQELPHPEGVTCMLRKLCGDGKDRIVTGCLDGRVRVWAADPPPPPPPPSPPTPDETQAAKAEGGGEGEDLPQPPPPLAFELEATLDGHARCAISALAWLEDHPSFPPPAPEAAADSTDDGAKDNAAKEEGDPAATPASPAFWPGCDSSLFFLSCASDRVRLWERRRWGFLNNARHLIHHVCVVPRCSSQNAIL